MKCINTGKIIYFANRIHISKEVTQSALYTNNVGYLHRSCTPWDERNSPEMTKLVVSQQSLSRGVHYLCRYLLLPETYFGTISTFKIIQCGKMVHFSNIICFKKEAWQHTPYTNNVGYLHRLRTPWDGRNTMGMTDLVVSQRLLLQGGYIICVDASFYPKLISEHYQPLKCIIVVKVYVQ